MNNTTHILFFVLITILIFLEFFKSINYLENLFVYFMKNL